MLDTLWSKFILQLNKENPFFACLALFTVLVPDDKIEYGVTDTKELRINPDFLLSESEEKAFSYLLHQVLHLALQHNFRSGGRKLEYWNIAADIVVNEIITSSTPWPTAPQTAWDDRFSDHCVEQVYAKLLEEYPTEEIGRGDADAEASSSTTESESFSDQANGNGKDPQPDCTNAINSNDASERAAPEDPRPSEDSNGASESESNDAGDGKSGNPSNSNESSPKSEVERLYQSSSDLLDRANPNNNEDKAASQRYWQNAVEQARIAIHDRRPGSLPGTLQREFDRAEKSTVDWRRELWRFVSDRQSDFSEFDLRHIHRGQYLEKLSIDALNLCVAIDTSASISRKELSIFLTELESIRSLYIDVAVTLYYCDTEVDGPHKMKSRISLENLPVGGGGTSFQPVFDEIDKLDINEKPDCILYFTDGYADFPDRYIKIPTLWVLTNDSHLTDADIPVGTMIRITPQAA